MTLDTDLEKESMVLRVCIGITEVDIVKADTSIRESGLSESYREKYRLYYAPQWCILTLNDKFYCGLPLIYPRNDLLPEYFQNRHIPIELEYRQIKEMCSLIQNNPNVKIEPVNGRLEWKGKNGEVLLVPGICKIPDEYFTLLTDILSRTSQTI